MMGGGGLRRPDRIGTPGRQAVGSDAAARERAREKERARARAREREKERENERVREREKEREKERAREKEREKELSAPTALCRRTAQPRMPTSREGACRHREKERRRDGEKERRRDGGTEARTWRGPRPTAACRRTAHRRAWPPRALRETPCLRLRLRISVSPSPYLFVSPSLCLSGSLSLSRWPPSSAAVSPAWAHSRRSLLPPLHSDNYIITGGRRRAGG